MFGEVRKDEWIHLSDFPMSESLKKKLKNKKAGEKVVMEGNVMKRQELINSLPNLTKEEKEELKIEDLKNCMGYKFLHLRNFLEELKLFDYDLEKMLENYYVEWCVYS